MLQLMLSAAKIRLMVIPLHKKDQQQQQQDEEDLRTAALVLCQEKYGKRVRAG